jgi:hypothetical protein
LEYFIEYFLKTPQNAPEKKSGYFTFFGGKVGGGCPPQFWRFRVLKSPKTTKNSSNHPSAGADTLDWTARRNLADCRHGKASRASSPNFRTKNQQISNFFFLSVFGHFWKNVRKIFDLNRDKKKKKEKKRSKT